MHITVVTASYPHEKEQVTFSLTIKHEDTYELIRSTTST